MSKELPYFKFEPNEWDNGNIQICSRESKGLFIDLCSIYWSRLGELPYALALQKLCNGQKDALKELIENEIIGVVDGQIVVEFLDEQLSEFLELTEKRRNAANKRWKDAHALQLESTSNAKREEETTVDKTKKEETPRRAFEIPFPLGSNEYDAWLEWEKYRKEIHKKLSPSTAKKQFKFLGGRAGPEIVAILEQSIQNGWTGLFELKNKNINVRTSPKGETRSTDAIIEPVKDFGIGKGFSRNNVNGRGG